MTNTGADAYDEGLSPTLITADGQEAEDATLSGGRCSGSEAAIPPGARRRICLPYTVAADAELGEFQVTLSPVASLGEQDLIAVWSLGGASSTGAGADLEPYRTPAYTAALPAGWRTTEDYVPQGGNRHVTKAVSPEGDAALTIDTTAGASGDPADSAATLEAGKRTEGSYERLAYRRITVGGEEGFEWAYEQNGRRKVDVLFFRGGDGFAVLAEGPPARYEELRSLARAVAESVQR